ncbi:putative dinucleotide-binding enzyme [Streptomyces canus]|nr:putative dinucleotide-binding enzyme [Streptomyces canus]MDQ1064768.1 putative dinucleotide-binding enzyme [Streptomyces canus]
MLVSSRVGDNAQAKAGVAAFIESLGLRPLDVGGLTSSRGRFQDDAHHDLVEVVKGILARTV